MQLAAEWILPITAPPIADAMIHIDGGVIKAVGQRPELADGEDLGPVVVVPGLINAHTHLELGHLADLAGQPPADLTSWLGQVVTRQQALPADQLDHLAMQAARSGAAACLDAGITAVGDVSQRPGATRSVLSAGPLRVVSFGEILGMGRRRGLAAERLAKAADRSHDSRYLSAALSPHAPFSIEAQGVRETVHYARRHGLRLCMHLAESLEELQFVRDGAGPLRDLLDSLGVLDEPLQPSGQTPVQWADALGLLGPDCLVAHGNYLDDEDLSLLCARGTSVAYCPRTHARFGHAIHPLLELLGRGVNVCVGTDSLASNPSLDLLPELAHIHSIFPELSPTQLLRMATINGARALGLAGQIGSLEPGKRADLAVFTLPREFMPPEEQLIGECCELLRLYINGERVR